MCCSKLSTQACTANLLPVLQLVVPWLCVFLIFALLAKYCIITEHCKEETPLLSKQPPSRIEALVDLLFVNNAYVTPLFIISIVITIFSIGVAGILVYFYGAASRVVVLYAQVYGIIALILLVIQYIPQIYLTHLKKEAGSLSIPMLVLQAPGSFAVVYFQAIMSHSSWTTWSPYLSTAIQQFLLIGQCAFYYCQKRKQKTQQEQPNSFIN